MFDWEDKLGVYLTGGTFSVAGVVFMVIHVHIETRVHRKHDENKYSRLGNCCNDC